MSDKLPVNKFECMVMSQKFPVKKNLNVYKLLLHLKKIV